MQGHYDMAPTKAPADRAPLSIKVDDKALMQLSPSLINLQSAVADMQLQDTRSSELDDELGAQLQHLGLQLNSFQEQLAQLIGASPVSIRRTTTSPLESCSSQDLGHVLSSDLSNSLYPCSSSCSRIASPKFWDSRCATPSAVNIPHLCDMLTDSNPAVQAAAVGSLRSLTGSSTNCCAVVEAGGVPSLVKLMAGSACNDTQEAASGVLWNVAATSRTADIQAVLVEAGAVKAAVQVLASSRDLNLLYQAVGLLAEFVSVSSNSSDREGDGVASAVLQQMAAAGAIPLLLALLSHMQQQQDVQGSSAVQAAALCCLKALAQVPANRVVLVASGAAAVLTALLTTGAAGSSISEEPLLAPTVDVMQQLCKEPASHADVMAAVGVGVLVQLLGSQATLQATVADALASLATSAQTHPAISAAGGIPALLDAVGSESQAVQAAGAAALQQLACSADIRQEIAAADGVQKLAEILCSTAAVPGSQSPEKSPSSPAVLQNAASALQNLVVDPDNCMAAIAASGLVSTLASLLQHSSSGVIAAAAGCLANIAWDSEGCAAVAACEGIMQQLVQCLGSSEQHVVVNAVNLVAKLAWEPELCSMLVAAGVLEPLVSLLSTQTGSSDSSSSSSSSGMSSIDTAAAIAAAAALQNLTYEDTIIRRACIEAGAVPVLNNTLQQYSGAPGSELSQQTQALTADSTIEHLILFALGALYNLALEPGNVSTIVTADAVKPLVWLLDSGSAELSAAAGRVVGKLAVNATARQVMAECREQSARS